MNTDFRNRQASYLFQLILISLVLFGVHQYILHYFASSFIFFFPLWHIYVFHILVAIIIYTLINYRYSKGNTEIFTLFMGVTLVKMILAIVFLLPLLLSDFQKKQPDVFNFFIPYFIYLFLEVFFVTKFLQKK
jgi:TM2 domain-containing membrane protein YozV